MAKQKRTRKDMAKLQTSIFIACTDWKQESKFTAEDHATPGGIANYACNTTEALQIMLQINNTAGEE